MGPGGVPKGSKTSDYYRVANIPGRFNNPGNYNVFSNTRLTFGNSFHDSTMEPVLNDTPRF